MISQPRWTKPAVILSIIVGGLLPVFLYWWVIGRVPTLEARDARELLSRLGENAVLVDVRDAEAFEARHLKGTRNWPYEKITAIASADQLPEAFKDKRLLFICDIGFLSARAAQRLQGLGVDHVYSVRGGMQEWVSAWEMPCKTQYCKFESASGQTEGLPFREMPGREQWAAVIAAFGFKPLYMLLSFLLALILRRPDAPDMVALRWGLIFFFIGEGFCAVNYLFLSEDSYLVEYLHSCGMVLALGFTTYAVLAGLDRRVIRFSDPEKRCAALDLCGSCIKYTDVSCGGRRLFMLLIPLPTFLTFIPLLTTPSEVSYNTYILGTLYNYSHLFIHQIFEIRYCPILAMILFVTSFLLLLFSKGEPVPEISKMAFSAGMGAFGFSMFRLLFVAVYRDNLVWYVFWEELTELLYVAMVAGVLWIFGQRLFQKRA